jgi:hypothetical protein
MIALSRIGRRKSVVHWEQGCSNGSRTKKESFANKVRVVRSFVRANCAHKNACYSPDWEWTGAFPGCVRMYFKLGWLCGSNEFCSGRQFVCAFVKFELGRYLWFVVFGYFWLRVMHNRFKLSLEGNFLVTWWSKKFWRVLKENFLIQDYTKKISMCFKRKILVTLWYKKIQYVLNDNFCYNVQSTLRVTRSKGPENFRINERVS